MNSAPAASHRQAVACPHLEVPGQVAGYLARSDHCNSALRRYCPVAPRFLVKARLVSTNLWVPLTGRWSTEPDRSHLAKKQPAAQKRCGVEDTVRHVSTE